MMNQDNYHGVVIILLIAILIVVSVGVWASANPESFNNAIAKMNQPMPNIIEAEQQAIAQAAANQDYTPFYNIGVTLLGGIAIFAVVFGLYHYSKKFDSSSNADEKSKEK